MTAIMKINGRSSREKIPNRTSIMLGSKPNNKAKIATNNACIVLTARNRFIFFVNDKIQKMNNAANMIDTVMRNQNELL